MTNQPAPSFNVGDRVAFTHYGAPHTGTVVSGTGRSIIFVKDDNGRTRWLHAASLTPAA